MKTKFKLGFKNWALIWGLGMAGQICWNIENQWFNTFVYENIAPDSSIIAWMVAISAIMTTISTFIFGTMSDRIGRRKPFVVWGYILWGIFTIVFGLTMYVPRSGSGTIMLIATLVVMADAIMSFFGSMGNSSGFNPWTTDLLNDSNRGVLGASLAAQPVLGTILGTVIGGIIIANLGYMWFFGIMGVFVILAGIIAAFTMKESPNLVAKKDGTFTHQFLKAFNFKEFIKNKELLWVFLMLGIFFIGFNVYFVHMGNIFIYNYGFTEDSVGIIEGVGLMIAILFTIPAAKLINKNKSPLLIGLSVIVSIIGLLVLYFFGSTCDPSGLFVSGNILLILGFTLVGIGYVVFLQTITIWTKKLYPSQNRGQFEGINIIFYVLIPMLIGPAIANPIIQNYGKIFTKEYSTGIITGQVPTELLFLVAAVITALTFIPLIKAKKLRDVRIESLK